MNQSDGNRAKRRLVRRPAEGKIGGVWLVSSMPDVFGSLATASLRQWQFDPIPAKIRIVLQFKP